MNAHPFCALVACAALAGCAHEQPNSRGAALSPESVVTTTSAQTVVKTPSLRVSREIIAACKIDFDAQKQPVEDRAPHFAFDQYDLLPADGSLLDQIADCLTTGPLAGRSIALIGRADPRGETEYNFVLGEHRASTVAKYLESRGVRAARVQATSRGELDALGTDELGWAADRRVDVLLL